VYLVEGDFSVLEANVRGGHHQKPNDGQRNDFFGYVPVPLKWCKDTEDTTKSGTEETKDEDEGFCNQ